MIFDAYMIEPPTTRSYPGGYAADPLWVPPRLSGTVKLAVTERTARQLLDAGSPALRVLILGPNCPDDLAAALREFVDASAGARDASDRERNARAVLAKKLTETFDV